MGGVIETQALSSAEATKALRFLRIAGNTALINNTAEINKNTAAMGRLTKIPMLPLEIIKDWRNESSRIGLKT